ncbi:MAG: M1 family metallopeptidase [Marinilabiliaceae bacterium]|jgi:aminopeptidase N|nr:M1 family metallopeptidase [Marinilabiliaceae bacterium]
MRKIFFLALLCFGLNLYSSDYYPLDPGTDIIRYIFNLHLTDSNDVIDGEALINMVHRAKTGIVTFDLTGRNLAGKGMTVAQVLVDKRVAEWNHENNRLKIVLPVSKDEGSFTNIEIKYRGIPADGLIISENRHGNRTFFADNWPDRARNWIPCVDHPSDKAKVEFKVYAPEKYTVVSNGLRVEESYIDDGIKLTHWKEEVSIPTKVMVIGVARFASQLLDRVGGTDIWTYVFPEDREIGFSDFSAAIDPFTFFSDRIGSYPYEKLANVQSKTIFGGMENAGCIFYSERTVSGNKRAESLMAHEIAHQWFGNSVTEGDWHHVWLSEGFATYFTSLYFEFKDGPDKLRSSMASSRTRVIRAIDRRPAPVIDTTITNFMELLSTYSYQKGAWVLHMLRNEMGDEHFNTAIRTYYSRFRNRNALTSDLRSTMEEFSQKDLETFFDQWLYRPDIPVLDIDWDYSARKKELTLNIRQVQEGEVFYFPLTVSFGNEGKTIREEIQINQKLSTFTIKLEDRPDKVIPDPDVKLLFREF